LIVTFLLWMTLNTRSEGLWCLDTVINILKPFKDKRYTCFIASAFEPE